MDLAGQLHSYPITLKKIYEIHKVTQSELMLNKKKLALENVPLKDTHREKALSNKTPVLTKSKNVGIWVVITSNNQINSL